MYSLWARADEGNADLLASPRKIRILREEPIAWMDAVCTMLPAPPAGTLLNGTSIISTS